MPSNNIGGSITTQRSDRDGRVFRNEIHERLRNAQEGLVNWVGEVELVDDGVATTTVVYDDKVTPNSQISLSPLNAATAALLPNLWISTLTEGAPWTGVNEGRFTINHPILFTGTYLLRYSIKG